MPGVRPLNKKYGISARKFNLIRSHCQMYEEWKSKIAEGYSTVKSPVLSGMPSGSGRGDPTGSRALLISEYTQKVETIEETVREVIGRDVGMYKYLLEYVTEPGTTFHYLKMSGMPCERTHFYKLARRFYIYMNMKI